MIIPVRCVTCGKVLADKWRAYEAMTGERMEAKKGKDEAAEPKQTRMQAMDELGLVRYCCRRHFISQVDLIEKI